MDNATITIIVPVYKAESTIERCVDSILAQSYSDWELILVDDGSPDDSGKICDHYAASDIRIRSLHVPNGGAGNARNHGLDNCKSKWVTFVDSDDSLEPGYLANFHLDSHQADAAIIIMQGYHRVTPDKKYLGEKIDLYESTYDSPDFLENAFISDSLFEYGQVVGKLYDIEIIRRNNIRFTSEFHLSEDHLFYLTYLCHTTKIVTYSGTLYNYIWEENTIGLSRKSHPYRELYRRYRVLLDVCMTLKSQYRFSHTNIERINYFSVTGSLSLLLQVIYSQEENIVNRKEMLRLILHDKSLLVEAFKPKSINGKMLRFVLLRLPLPIADLLLAFALKH